MNDLIEALTILSKYCDLADKWPTNCDHDVFFVKADETKVSPDDRRRLDVLGFMPDDDGGFLSYRFGSC